VEGASAPAGVKHPPRGTRNARGTLEHALVVARQLLPGLRAIHRSGVLHLDMKSSNIMLRHGRPDEALILDVGLPRSVSRAARQRDTRPLTGSLAYMPPEQILGRSPGFRQ
jgi:eukaryotic-like serine/threonine-protein kinase